jgi:hypothetical protein
VEDVESEIGRPVCRDKREHRRLEDDHAGADPVARRWPATASTNRDSMSSRASTALCATRHRARRAIVATPLPTAMVPHKRIEAARRQVVTVDDDEGAAAKERLALLHTAGGSEQVRFLGIMDPHAYSWPSPK